MTKVTVAVPFRAGALDREIHAEYVSARLREMVPDATHLVVDVEGEFSRARVRNEAVRLAGSGVVVLCDADTLPEEHALTAAIEGAAQDGRLHLPYTRYRALSPEGTLAVYARGVHPGDAPVEDESRRPIGGVWVISTDAWWRAGGMDETFKGWGFEDDSFFTAANVLLGQTVRHEGTITHLHHKPAANLQSPEYRRNRARFQQYVRARRSPEQMRTLVGVPDPTKLRVVVLAHYYLPVHRAGAEIMLHELLKPLAARGHKVQVWATDEVEGAEVDGVTVHAGTPETVDADVVVSHLKSVPIARKLAKKADARFVQVAHSAAPWVVKDVRAGADLVVANSEHVAQGLKRRGDTLVVHPPVYAARHRTRPGRRVTLINPIPAKGSGVFYELARRMPGVQFLAVEGGYQQSEQVRERLPNVRWQPHTADMRTRVWAHTRVLLMPSAEESYGMAAVEAATSGIPTIASDLPGLRESLGDAGTFLDPDNIDAWETTLRDMLGAGWRLASKKTLARSAELDPKREVEAWVKAIECL